MYKVFQKNTDQYSKREIEWNSWNSWNSAYFVKFIGQIDVQTINGWVRASVPNCSKVNMQSERDKVLVWQFCVQQCNLHSNDWSMCTVCNLMKFKQYESL